jgi:SAM-dependent methyltransferase
MINPRMTADERYKSTISYYEGEAPNIAATYEAVDFRAVIDRMLSQLPEGGKLLDVGCGSGRDAAYFLDRGFDVTGTDASKAMIAEAVRHHPELADRLLQHRLPGPLPFADRAFDVAVAMAVLMHLTEADARRALAELVRVTRPGGIVAYSVSIQRPGLDSDGLDNKKRYFLSLSSDEWRALNAPSGLFQVESWESEDLGGRGGIRWATFVSRRE